MDRNIPVWVPLAAVLIVGVMLGTLGMVFTVLSDVMNSKYPVIVIGVALTIGVPIGGWLLSRGRTGPSH